MTIRHIKKPEWYTGVAENIEQHKKNKKDKEIAETLEKKQLPKGKEVKLKRNFYLYVGDTVFSVWFNGHDYRIINLSNNKISWISQGEEKILGREGKINVDKTDRKASRYHLKLRVDDKSNLFLCDNSKDGTFVNNLPEDDNEQIILEMFRDLIGETKLWDWITLEDLLKIKKLQEELGINFKNKGSLMEKYCKEISRVKDSYIEEVINCKKELDNIMGDNYRDLNRIVFFSKLAEEEILDDFIKVFDIRPGNQCVLDNIPLIENLDFKKLKKFKSQLKLKNKNIGLDYDIIDIRLSPLETLEETTLPPLLKGVETGQQNYVILNPDNFEYVRAEKVGENEYIINANMPSNQIPARKSLILLCENLPKGARIVEKKSLSCDSFRLIAHLYKEQKEHKLKISFKMSDNDKIQLNREGLNSRISQLVKEKNTGNDEELFETDSKDEAEQIVNEINKLILKYTGNDAIYAEINKIEKGGGKVTWGIKLPGFEIEKC